jgi:hypothetical protein
MLTVSSEPVISFFNEDKSISQVLFRMKMENFVDWTQNERLFWLSGFIISDKNKVFGD